MRSCIRQGGRRGKAVAIAETTARMAPPSSRHRRSGVAARSDRPLLSRAVQAAGPVLLAVLLALLLAGMPAAGDDGRIDAATAHAAALAGERTLIDVRSPREWRDTGLPDGGVPITIHGPDGWDGFLAGVLALVAGDRSRPIALICAAGNRSAAARRFLHSRGFSDVADVSEGMIGRQGASGVAPSGWIRRGLPTARHAGQ